MREMNRLSVTSAIDAGGGFQNYPDDYGVITELHRRNQMTVRVAYNLFTQRPKHELDDFKRWTGSTILHQGDSTFRLNGAGEMLVFSAADFEQPSFSSSGQRPLRCEHSKLCLHLPLTVATSFLDRTKRQATSSKNWSLDGFPHKQRTRPVWLSLLSDVRDRLSGCRQLCGHGARLHC